MPPKIAKRRLGDVFVQAISPHRYQSAHLCGLSDILSNNMPVVIIYEQFRPLESLSLVFALSHTPLENHLCVRPIDVYDVFPINKRIMKLLDNPADRIIQ